MLNPSIIQSWCRTLSTKLAVRQILTTSFGCRLQFRQPNSTFTEAELHCRNPVIHPEIIKFITPSAPLLFRPLQNVAPKQRSESYISPGRAGNINSTLRLPGLNNPQNFIYPVPLGYFSRIPQEKNLPPVIIQEKLDPRPYVRIREPSTIHSSLEKLAARLIQIRKKKMKKHRFYKLQKRMFFTWEKIKQRRAARMEKHFVDCQLARIKNAEDFDAQEWVKQYLVKSTTDPETLIVPKPKLPRPTKYVF